MSDEDVNAVLEFAQSGPLFAGSTQSSGARLLTSFEEAYARATRQPEPDSPWTIDWTDLREHRMATLHSLEYDLPRERQQGVRERAGEVRDMLSAAIRPRLRTLGFVRAQNEVSVDLEKIATSRLLQGTRDPFWEQVFAL